MSTLKLVVRTREEIVAECIRRMYGDYYVPTPAERAAVEYTVAESLKRGHGTWPEAN